MGSKLRIHLCYFNYRGSTITLKPSAGLRINARGQRRREGRSTRVLYFLRNFTRNTFAASTAKRDPKSKVCVRIRLEGLFDPSSWMYWGYLDFFTLYVRNCLTYTMPWASSKRKVRVRHDIRFIFGRKTLGDAAVGFRPVLLVAVEGVDREPYVDSWSCLQLW